MRWPFNPENIEIRTHLFNFKSLLGIIFLRCRWDGNFYIDVHISHDLAGSGGEEQGPRLTDCQIDHISDRTRDVDAVT